MEYQGDKKGNVVGTTRRVLITLLRGGKESVLDDVAHLLAGKALSPIDHETPSAILEPLDFENHIETTYLQYSSSWATVTPVILPGFDDPGGIRKKLSKKSDSRLTAAEKNQLLQKLDARIDQLLRKSIRQAGYSEQLAQHADISWRGTGFLPGTVLSQNYFVPSHLQRFRRYHVRINWRDENGNPIKIPGPLILGGGRFIGMGLFASLKSLV